MSSPVAITITALAFLPSFRIAYTLPAVRVPTKSVPFSPSAMERASSTPCAKIVISNPGGSFTRSSGSFDWAIASAATDATRNERAMAIVFMVGRGRAR